MELVSRLATELAILLENAVHPKEWNVRHKQVLDVLRDASAEMIVEKYPIPDPITHVLARSVREH